MFFCEDFVDICSVAILNAKVAKIKILEKKIIVLIKKYYLCKL